jgi:hypothetical protein
MTRQQAWIICVVTKTHYKKSNEAKKTILERKHQNIYFIFKKPL